MNENEISYDFFDESNYEKYYLLKYNIYNKENNPINFGDKVLISISNTKYDPKNPNSYKDELVKITGSKISGKGKNLTGSFVNTTGNTAEYRSGSIILNLENIKEVIIPIDGKENKIYYTYLHDPSFGKYYLRIYRKPEIIGKNLVYGDQVLISYARENPEDLRSYKDVWVELGQINLEDGTRSATFINRNKYEDGEIRLYDKHVKDIR